MKRSNRAGFTALVCVSLLRLSDLGAGQGPRSPLEFGLNRVAKILCSAAFVSGRDLDEALQNSARRILPTSDWQRLASLSEGNSDAEISIDQTVGTVDITLRGFTGRAKYTGDQGCVILPAGLDEVFFEPVKIPSSLPDPMTQTWPMGDRPPEISVPSRLEEAKVQQAIDAAFEGAGLTAALVAVHKGQIIGERYAQGADKDTQLESWSMGKSLTATLVGILVRQGHLSLDDPAPWSCGTRIQRIHALRSRSRSCCG